MSSRNTKLRTLNSDDLFIPLIIKIITKDKSSGEGVTATDVIIISSMSLRMVQQ